MKRENKQLQDWNNLVGLVGKYRYYQTSFIEDKKRETLRKLEVGIREYAEKYQTPFNPCVPPELPN